MEAAVDVAVKKDHSVLCSLISTYKHMEAWQRYRRRKRRWYMAPGGGEHTVRVSTPEGRCGDKARAGRNTSVKSTPGRSDSRSHG